jgi:trehalose synthase
MRGFAEFSLHDHNASLVLAGPALSAVADDPESAHVLADCTRFWHELPDAVRQRVHLATLPMADVEENAVIVNALQRHARVIVQKSLAEGYGLTVVEAMYKSRPVVGSRLGGIADQIEHGETGMLVDPLDTDEFTAALDAILSDPELAERLGTNARRWAIENCLPDRQLEQWADLIEEVVGS